MRKTTVLARRVLVSGVMACIGAGATAQQMPCDLASARELGVEDQQTVRGEASRLMDLLASGNTHDAWEGVRAYFECDGVSPAFRAAFAQGAVEKLEEASRGEPRVAYTAFMVAGLAGGTDIERSVLRPGLSDDRPPAVRFAAARAYRPLLGNLAGDDAGVGEARRIIQDVVGPALQREGDPGVASAMVSALDNVRDTRLEAAALGSVALGVEAIARNTPVGEEAAWSEVMAIAMSSARPRLVNPEIANRLPRQTRVDLAASAGAAMGWVQRTLAAGIPQDGPTRDAMRRLVTQANDVLTLVSASLGGSGAAQGQLVAGFDGSLEAGGVGPFAAALSEWTGPQGRLTRQPFNLDPARFRSE